MVENNVNIVKRLHAQFSKSSEFNQTALTRDVASLTGELWNLILPHLMCLSTDAENDGQKRNGGSSSTNDESIWFDAFETTFPGLEVTATNMGVEETSVAYKAVVKLYPHFG
jgi:hypothetical protein